MSQDSRARQQRSEWGDGSTRSTEALIALALSALASRRGRAFDDAAVALAQRCSDTDGRRSVVSTLVENVAAATTQAWERGWQPADVQRVAARTVGGEEQALVVDALSEELGRYAASTVDRRWLAQVDELDGGVWWPRSQTWLDARRDRGVDWLTLLSRTLAVLHLLWTLPTIERLSPLPGSLRPPEPGAAPNRPSRASRSASPPPARCAGRTRSRDRSAR